MEETYQVISYYIFLGIRISRVTLDLVPPDKRETSVGILDSRNIYFGADVFN